MIISSTQFQQNVGYYLKQVEMGKEVIIEKLRPKGIYISLTLKENTAVNARLEKLNEIRREINKKRIQFGGTNDGIEYQNKVRD